MTRRTERVNKLIRQEISELIQRHIKDPRLGGFVSVTEVFSSPDMKYARILVSSICSEDEKQETLSALASATGFIRNELGRRLKLRRVPGLSFEWDSSIERGAHILELIDKIVTDEER